MPILITFVLLRGKEAGFKVPETALANAKRYLLQAGLNPPQIYGPYYRRAIQLKADYADRRLETAGALFWHGAEQLTAKATLPVELTLFGGRQLDDSLRGKADIEANFGAPVLAMVPKVSRWRRKKDPKLLGLAGEAYRTLRTRLLFDATRDSAKVYMITSASAGEGKTTTASNLAIALAGAGKRVVLVSADLRRPRVQELFGLNAGPGLADLLSGSISLPEVLVDPGIKNLRILASGPLPERPADLLEQSMVKVLADLRAVADFVVLDTPPLLRVADTLELIPMADRLVYVVDPDMTPRSVLRSVREQLDQMGASVLGIVVSNVKPGKAKAYGVYIHRLGYPQEQAYLEAHRDGQRKPEMALDGERKPEKVLETRPDSAAELAPGHPAPAEAETSSS